MTQDESDWIEWVKNQDCGVCSTDGPSDAHHILENSRRISHFATIPLCKSCHQDNHNGIHGRKAMWQIMKLTELDVLAATIGRYITYKRKWG